MDIKLKDNSNPNPSLYAEACYELAVPISAS